MADLQLPLDSPVANGLLGQLLDMGGPVMMVLLVIAVIGLATFVYLMLLGTLYAPRLPAKLKKIITIWQQNPTDVSPESVRREAGRWGRLNPLLHVITDSMTAKLNREDDRHIREVAARDAQQSLEPFEAPLKIIEVIAALAPLLGLLGTVLGMMEAFSAMAATEGRANATQLSGGIYEALTTTAAGLVVAIPFAALAAWIEFRLRRIHKTITRALVSVLNVLPAPESASDPQQNLATGAEPADTSVIGGGPESDYPQPDHRRFAHATG